MSLAIKEDKKMIKIPKLIYSNLSKTDNKCSRLEEKINKPVMINTILNIKTALISFLSLNKTLIL